MTIIEPNKNKFKIGIFAFIIIALIIIEAVFSIFAYNKSVHLGHGLRDRSGELEALAVENADLKNKLYEVLDFQNADKLAERLGLVKERKPEYLARQ